MTTSHYHLRIDQTASDVRGVSISVLFLIKSSRRISSQHLLFQSLNSNTIVGQEGSSSFKKVTTKTKVDLYSTLHRFEQRLHIF